MLEIYWEEPNPAIFVSYFFEKVLRSVDLSEKSLIELTFLAFSAFLAGEFMPMTSFDATLDCWSC